MTDKDKTEELVRTAFSTFRENAPLDMSPSEYIADYLIANGVTVNEWRPASELPKDECPCIILSSKGGKMLIAQYKPEQRSWSYIANQHLISHWMPLPQPPKEVE